jgi:hypothetical protein
LSTAPRFDLHPSAYLVNERVPKRQRTKLHARNGVHLNSVMGVVNEMARLLRLSYNGHLPSTELTRYIYALDRIRAGVESAKNLEIQAAANAPKPQPAPTSVSIVAIPPNVYLDEAAMQRLNEQVDHFPRRPLIEYNETPSAPATEAVQSEPASEAGPIEPCAPAAPEAPPPASKPKLVHDEEPDPLRRRARALGFEPLPRRSAQAE